MPRCLRCHHDDRNGRAPNPNGCAVCNPHRLGERLREEKYARIRAEADAKELGLELQSSEACAREGDRHCRELDAELTAARAEVERLIAALNEANALRQADQNALAERIAGLEADTATLNSALIEARRELALRS